MRLKLAWNLPDGTVTVFNAAPKEQLEKAVGKPVTVDGVVHRVLTDDEYRAFVLEQIGAKGVLPAVATDLVELPDDWTPPDRAFRSAWKKAGVAFDYNMAECRNITRDRLRREREPLLRALDVEAIRAGETDNRLKIAEVAAQKQALRDITADPRIEAAVSIEELKAIKVA